MRRTVYKILILCDLVFGLLFHLLHLKMYRFFIFYKIDFSRANVEICKISGCLEDTA